MYIPVDEMPNPCLLNTVSPLLQDCRLCPIAAGLFVVGECRLIVAYLKTLVAFSQQPVYRLTTRFNQLNRVWMILLQGPQCLLRLMVHALLLQTVHQKQGKGITSFRSVWVFIDKSLKALSGKFFKSPAFRKPVSFHQLG